MTAAFDQTDGGLLLPRGAQEAAVRRLLEEHDRNLRLYPVVDYEHQMEVWIVAVQTAPGQSRILLSWRDENGVPLPLSSAILDRVQQHDRNTRGGFPDEDKLNDEHIARARRESAEWGDEIVREFGPRIEGRKSSPLPRSRSLQLARQRVRERTTTEELKP